MSEWYNEFNGAFWISIVTLSLAAIGVCVKSSLSSKCSHTSFCYGCIECDRNIQAEEDIEIGREHNDTIPSAV